MSDVIINRQLVNDAITSYGIRTLQGLNDEEIKEALPYEDEPIVAGAQYTDSQSTVNISPEFYKHKGAQYECPSCAREWVIAGYYEKTTEGINGTTVISLYTCYSCLKVGIPKKRERPVNNG